MGTYAPRFKNLTRVKYLDYNETIHSIQEFIFK